VRQRPALVPRPGALLNVTKRCPRCRKTFESSVQVCPDDGATLTVPPTLDPAVSAALSRDYRILDSLGTGGMGAVYLAEQIRVGNRKVALKVLHRKFSEDEEFITRFENEAASTGRINHPNVITIYESKQASDGTLYIAMELVEGESLTEHLRKRGRLPLEEAVDIVVQCCKALAAAHRLGIIHRDIKPDNIMLARDLDGGTIVKILDFGIAKLKDSGGHTVTGSVLGTPAYMSYEQASGMSSEKLDGRSDIYSLGIVTYVMLAGQPPFRAETPVGYITKHLSEAPPTIRTLRPDLPAGVEAAVMKALEKDREHRHQTAADFGLALREAAKPAPAGAASVVEPTPTPPWRARPGVATTTKVNRASEPTVPLGPPTAPTPIFSPAPASRTPTVPPARGEPTPRAVPPIVTPRRAPPVSPAPPRVPVAPPWVPPGQSRAAPPVEPPVGVPAGDGRPVVPRPAPAPAPRIPAAPRHAPVQPAEKPATPGESWEGLAVAVWGIRTLVSWGMTVYGVVFLLLFVRPFVTALLPASLFVPLDIMGQPFVDRVAQWLPYLRYADADFVPLALGAALLLLRPRITTPLSRLETRWRARALAAEALE
jgi:serine/threonine-protein kinase